MIYHGQWKLGILFLLGRVDIIEDQLLHGSSHRAYTHKQIKKSHLSSLLQVDPRGVQVVCLMRYLLYPFLAFLW